MYEQERAMATAIVAEVCGLAREVQREIVSTADHVTKGDRSPVTVADLAIQVVASRRLADAFPDDPLVAEEDTAGLETPAVAERVHRLAQKSLPDLNRQEMNRALDRGDHGGSAGRYWVLDPIDGTKGFLRGEQYAVALALIEQGEVAVGVLGCPNLAVNSGSGEGSQGCMFIAVRGGGARQRALDSPVEVAISVDEISDPTQAVICESVEAAHSAHSRHAGIAARLGIAVPPYRIDSQCKYAVVSRGEASLYFRLATSATYREKVWDHAAGALVIEEAGGRVSDLEGRPLDFGQGRFLNRKHGILVSNGHLHELVLRAAREELALG